VAEGVQYLAFPSGGQSSVATNVALAPQALYFIRFAYNSLVGGEEAGISIWVNGTHIKTIQKTPAGWSTESALFRASAAVNQVEFRSPTGLRAFAIDQISINEADPPQNSFYLPEEALKP